MTRPAHADRDLIVALQDFDRLQQEFATLADVFTLAAAKSSDSWLRDRGQRSPSRGCNRNGISIADLKERLERQPEHFSDWTLAPASAGERSILAECEARRQVAGWP